MHGLKRREPNLDDHRAASAACVRGRYRITHGYHYDLDSVSTGLAVLAGGFKIPDYRLDGVFTGLIDAFKTKQKYADVFKLVRRRSLTIVSPPRSTTDERSSCSESSDGTVILSYSRS